MHQPRPHGQTAVGGAPTDDDSAAIELLARRLTNLRQLSGVESLRMVRTLPDGGYAVAQDMGGTFRVIIHKPEMPPPPPPFDGLAKDHIPMLFSGVITRARLRQGEGVGIKLSEQARLRLANYDPQALPAKQVSLHRFNIEYAPAFSEFMPQDPGALTHTQYVAQRPTWYSGAMAEVMQIVGGYGRQALGDLPDDPVERARMEIPHPVMQKIQQQVGVSVRLPGYTGLPDKKGQFQYDYKFNNTDGVSFDSANRPWLVRVKPGGVWAMPLPLIPATCTAAFREYIEEQGDDEVIAILNRFGGMPSGEGFPKTEDYWEAWRRAGVIIKVCDTADFYDHIAYSTACGWSFNLSGTEGFNTCYDYYDEEGLGYGLAYKLKLQLGSVDEDGKLPPDLKPEDPEQAARLDAYLSALYRLMSGNTPQDLAVKYKLRRVEASQILARAEAGGDPQSELDYWDALTLAPIASHGGSLREVGRGYLYHGAIFMYQPQIKYPEPWQGGCVSHDFLPLINGRYKDSYPDCDTIMFGYYVGDDLKVVKYFREDGDYQREVESDYEDCMIVGSWTQTATYGPTSLTGHFYTSDFDERKALAPVIETTRIVGKDLGYDSKPFFGFDDFFSMCGSMWRNRYFSRRTTVHRTEGHSLNVGVCIPYLMRNAVLHAKKEGTSGDHSTDSAALHYVRDPNNYRYFTYDFMFAWVGCSTKGNAETAPGSPVPYPKDGSPVWVVGRNYDPSECSDFADQGPWVPAIPADYTWLIHPSRKDWMHSGGGGAPKFNPYTNVANGEASESGRLDVSIREGGDNIHSEVPATMYFLGSPDPYVGVFYRDACKAVFGQAAYANVSEDVGGRRKYWGHCRLVDHDSAHHFIGVIHE